MVRIAVLDDYQGIALAMADWSAVQARAEVAVFGDTLKDEDALVRRLAGFDVVCAMRERTPFPRALLARLPDLKLLVTTGMRNASIDTAAATECGVTVCGTSGSGTSTVELTWALILGTVRQLPAQDASMRAGGWQVGLGGDLGGRTLACLGLGRLGGQVAKIGLAFGMNVIAWSPNLTEARCAEIGATKVDRETLFREADVLTVHVVLGERSRGMVGAGELAQMKPGAILVNTSRGPIVDGPALLAALRTGRIAGAGLDVYDEEPLPADHPLRRAPNTVLTPHVGYVSQATYRTMYAETVEDVLAWLDGTPARVIAAP